MSEVVESIIAAASVLFISILASLFVANIMAGGRSLPFGLSRDTAPMSGPIALSGVVVFGALAIGAQIALVAAAIGPNPMFGPSGTRVLLLEPPIAIGWAWYLSRRYQADVTRRSRR